MFLQKSADDILDSVKVFQMAFFLPGDNVWEGGGTLSQEIAGCWASNLTTQEENEELTIG